MRTTKSAISGLLAIASLAASGCANPAGSEGPAPQIGSSVDELIGGVQANSPALDAIGALGVVVKEKNCDTGEFDEYFIPYCTASLISSSTIVTAKHCVDAMREYQTYYGYESAFGIGSDGNNPKRIVPAVDYGRAPGNEGGFVELGRDVGVVHLGETVTDVAPLKFAELPANAIGKKYGAIGYGVQDNTGKSGTRMAGSITVNATSGKIFELVFGSFEAFREWYLTGEAPEEAIARLDAADAGFDSEDGGVYDGSDDDWLDAYLRQVYDTTLLLDGYEAYVGNRDGDAQICFGDSGSPLVKAKSNGELVAYGVVSGGIGSNRLICDYGGTYAIFGAEVNDWLKTKKGWKDPCKGISEDGICDGKVAKRCTNPLEGERRLTKTNCGLFGQTCAVASNGEAVCAAPGEEPIVLPEPEVPDNCWYEDAGMGGDGDGDGVPADGSVGEGDNGLTRSELTERVRQILQNLRSGALGKQPTH